MIKKYNENKTTAEVPEPAAPRPVVNPPPRRRPSAERVTPDPLGEAAEPASTRNAPTGKVRVRRSKEHGKHAPTGDYAIGYCKPPEQSRFRSGNPGGPGRPRGARSQDSIMRKELEAKQTVRIGGRMVTLSMRELIPKVMLKKAIEANDTKLLLHSLQYATRLYSEGTEVDSMVGTVGNSSLDRQVLANLLSGLTLGEPNPNCLDPLASLITELPDLSANISDGDWAGDASDAEGGEVENDDGK